MGYCILTYPDGSREILGDENQARKAEGLPYYDKSGRYVSEAELTERDKQGE